MPYTRRKTEYTVLQHLIPPATISVAVWMSVCRRVLAMKLIQVIMLFGIQNEISADHCLFRDRLKVILCPPFFFFTLSFFFFFSFLHTRKRRIGNKTETTFPLTDSNSLKTQKTIWKLLRYHKIAPARSK